MPAAVDVDAKKPEAGSMYLELLGKLYYSERKLLEGMWVYQQETKLKLLGLRKRITQELESTLTVHQIKGRADIADEIKEKMLFDNENGDKIEVRLSENIEKEYVALEKDTQQALGGANYSAAEFADYLFQLEKVYALERILEEEKLYPQGVYYEQKRLFEAKDSPTA
jgi:hypothetical protein